MRKELKRVGDIKMLKQVIAKEKCYIILYYGIYCSNRIVGVFQKKENF